MDESVDGAAAETFPDTDGGGEYQSLPPQALGTGEQKDAAEQSAGTPGTVDSPSVVCMSPNTQMMPPPSPNTTKLLAGLMKHSHDLMPSHTEHHVPVLPTEPVASTSQSADRSEGFASLHHSNTRTSVTGNQGDKVDKIFRGLKEKDAATLQKWAEIFGESESFELMCPVRLDAMLTEARAIEKDLATQKEKIVARLQQLHSTLQQSWEA